MSKKEVQIQPAVQQPQVIPFRKMGEIRMANDTLKAMNSTYRVGNLMNPALRQSMWDTSNLTGKDTE